MTLRFALLVITDGRASCLERTAASYDLMVTESPTARIIIDDSADPAYAAWLDETYPSFNIVHHDERRGFCGAIQSGWEHIPDNVDWVLHCEDDLVFNRPVTLQHFADVLDAHPHLAQMVLRRQAWSPEEVAAGGVVQMWPDLYFDHDWEGHHWLEHKLYFSTNTGLYRRSLLDVGWPDPPGCEVAFTDKLLADNPDCRFGLWGRREEPPWITHIGDARIGAGY